MSSGFSVTPQIVQAQLPGFELPAPGPEDAVLGAEVRAFVDRFGRPHPAESQPPNMLFFRDILLDFGIMVLHEVNDTQFDKRRVTCVTLVDPPEEVRREGKMVDKWAANFMKRFHPRDARWLDQDHVTAHGVTGWFIGFDQLYHSRWLGAALPAELFKNRAGQQVEPGLFDLQCVYEQGTKYVTGVTLAIGSVLLDDVRVGEPG